MLIHGLGCVLYAIPQLHITSEHPGLPWNNGVNNCRFFQLNSTTNWHANMEFYGAVDSLFSDAHLEINFSIRAVGNFGKTFNLVSVSEFSTLFKSSLIGRKKMKLKLYFLINELKTSNILWSEKANNRHKKSLIFFDQH